MLSDLAFIGSRGLPMTFSRVESREDRSDFHSVEDFRAVGTFALQAQKPDQPESRGRVDVFCRRNITLDHARRRCE